MKYNTFTVYGFFISLVFVLFWLFLSITKFSLPYLVSNYIAYVLVFFWIIGITLSILGLVKIKSTKEKGILLGTLGILTPLLFILYLSQI